MGVVVILMGLVFIGQVTFLQRTIKPGFTPATGLAARRCSASSSPSAGPRASARPSPRSRAMSLNSGSVGRACCSACSTASASAIPFLLVALGFGWATRSIALVKRHIRVINIVGGSLLMLIGLLMVTGLWTDLMSRVGAVIANYGTVV